MTPLVGRESVLTRIVGALDADTTRGIALLGERGVGRTRLARAVADYAEDRGYVSAWVSASTTAREFPLGALVHLAPEALDNEGMRGARDALQAITGLSDDSPLLVVVDDAHLLDDLSALVVHRLAADQRAFVVLTVDAHQAAPDAIVRMWHDHVIDAVPLEPLEGPDIERLVESVLGEQTTAVQTAEIRRLSDGLPRFAIALALDNASWPRDELRIGPESRAAVGRYLGTGREVEDVVALLAVGGSVPVAQLEAMGEIRGFDRLQTDGLARVVSTRGGEEAQLARELYVRVLREELPVGRRRSLARRLIATSSPETVNGLRELRWHQAAGDDPTGDILVIAARQALELRRMDEAFDLARQAVDRDGSAAAHLLVGQLHADRGEDNEAERHLALAQRLTDDQALRAEAVARRIGVLAFTGTPPAELKDLARRSIEQLSDPDDGAMVASQMALTLGATGPAREAITLAQEVLDDERVSLRATVGARVAAGFAEAMLGRCGAAEDHVQRAQAILDGMRPRDLQLTAMVAAIGAFVAHLRGQASEAYAVAQRARDRLLDRGAAGLAGIPTSALGFALQGACPTASAAALLAASEYVGQSDTYRLMPTLTAARAYAETQRGNLDAAEALLQRAGEPAGDRRAHAWWDRAHAWSLPATADRCEALTVAGQRALDHDYTMWGALILHDCVRLGAARTVTDDLAKIVGDCDAGLLEILAAHACAEVEGDAQALAEVSGRFAAAGQALYAAESALAAARLTEDEARRRQLEGRGLLLLRGCPGAATPALQPLPEPPSDRQLEIADLAVEGLTSQQIAGRLHLSPRTIDNQLGELYRQWGIHSREELAGLYPPEPARAHLI